MCIYTAVKDFEELYKYDYTASEILSLAQHWKDGKTYSYMSSPRPDNGLMLYTSASAVYRSKDNPSGIEVHPGDLLFAPKGCFYNAEFFNCPSAGMTNYLINFKLTDENGNDFSPSCDIRLLLSDVLPLSERFSKLLSLTRNALTPPARIKAAFYELVTDISLMLKSERQKKNTALYSPVQAAVDYISENYLSPNLRVGDLPLLCHMSDANFRRVFTHCEGISPKAYIMKLKLDCATALLKRGDFSVAETARYVGIEDASYFVRIYRKTTGMTPGKIESLGTE